MESIYITSVREAAELRCTDHPKWWADADGTGIIQAVQQAVAHLRDEHRTHVQGCACRARVTDSRCLPRLSVMILDGPS